MSVLVQSEAPDFTATAIMPDDEICEDFSLHKHRGRYVVLFVTFAAGGVHLFSPVGDIGQSGPDVFVVGVARNVYTHSPGCGTAVVECNAVERAAFFEATAAQIDEEKILHGIVGHHHVDKAVVVDVQKCRRQTLADEIPAIE